MTIYCTIKKQNALRGQILHFDTDKKEKTETDEETGFCGFVVVAKVENTKRKIVIYQQFASINMSLCHLHQTASIQVYTVHITGTDVTYFSRYKNIPPT